MPTFLNRGVLIPIILFIAGITLGLIAPRLLEAMGAAGSLLLEQSDRLPPGDVLIGVFAAVAAFVLLLLMVSTWRSRERRLLFWKKADQESLPEVHARLAGYLPNPEMDDDIRLAPTMWEWMIANALTSASSDDEFRRAFTPQLGNPFSSTAEPEAHCCAMLIMWLFRTRRSDLAMNVAKVLNECIKQDKPFPQHDGLVDMNMRAALAEYIREHASRHAYASTMLMSMLADARRSSSVVITGLRWLSIVKPALWHALDNTGRACPMPEALGIASHFEAENKARTALTTPALDRAIASARIWMLQYSPGMYE